MSPSEKTGKRAWIRRQDGFSMLEMLITLFILLSVAGIVMAAMMQMTNTQGSVANRTAMHSSIRSATELLQQEIGQAGRIAVPPASLGGPTKMNTAITAGPTGNIVNTDTGYTGAVSLDGVTGVYSGMQLVVDTGDQEETVAVTNLVPATKTFTGTFFLPHATGVPVRVVGAFGSGVVPTNYTCGTPAVNCGSTPYLLKLYGDINDDGIMQYIEYYCDTSGGNLYRDAMSFTAGSKPTLSGLATTPSLVLLPNITPNPADPGGGGPAPCFKYQQQTVTPNTYVTDVSVTLTVQTQNLDPQTHVVQKETKALLNVSPRNIFEGWQLGSGGVKNRIQPIPATVTNLLPDTP